ncbi:MAG: IPT/TIG domain-containing protein [Gemmatirosa sp.]
MLADPLVVLVTDSLGRPARGVPVEFRLAAGRGATLLDSLVVTDAAGGAATRLRLGIERDTAVVVAQVPGRDDDGVRFLAVATAPSVLRQIVPGGVAGGDTVLIRGLGLGAPVGTVGTVLFGTARARLLATVGDTLLRVIVPPCLPGGDVAVTAQVGAATTNPLPVTVVEASRPVALLPFEAITITGSDAAGCARLGSEGGRYLVFPQFASTEDPSPARSSWLTVDAATGADLLASVTPSLAARPATARETLERTLRAAERRQARAGIADEAERLALASRQARVAADPAPLAGRPIPDPPAVGTERTFRVLSRVDGTAYASATARLRFVGSNVLVYEDRATPVALDSLAMRRVGLLLDGTLHPLDVELFGAESDVDGNGRVIVLLTPIVNALTTSAQCSSEGFVRGFFNGSDLGTRSQNSNRAEVLYMMVPDPSGTRSCAHFTNDVVRQLPSTFLHEFQHMISYNQHVLVRRGEDETTWLNEGLSHVAEEMGGRLFERRYPAPLGRGLPTQLLPDSAVPFYRGDIDNALLYLGAPGAHAVSALDGLGSLEERGASWLFLRWLMAQKGESILARLVQTPRTGRHNVEEVAGEPFAAMFGDFVIAVVADSIGGVPRSRVPARYRFGDRAIRRLLTQGLGRDSRWTLAVRAGPGFGNPTALGAIVPGGFEIFDVFTPRGQATTLRFATPSGGPFPTAAEAQLGILRISQ